MIRDFQEGQPKDGEVVSGRNRNDLVARAGRHQWL